jgi:hypothetical protein
VRSHCDTLINIQAGKKIEQFVTEYQPNKIHYNQILRYYSLQRDEESALKVVGFILSFEIESHL